MSENVGEGDENLLNVCLHSESAAANMYVIVNCHG